MDDDTHQAQPTSYDFIMAVDNGGEAWVSAYNVVMFFRAVSAAMVSDDMVGLTVHDVSEAMTIEADALELRIHEMISQDAEPPCQSDA